VAIRKDGRIGKLIRPSSLNEGVRLRYRVTSHLDVACGGSGCRPRRGLRIQAMRKLPLLTGLFFALVLELLAMVAAILLSGEYFMPSKIFYIFVVPTGVVTAIIYFRRYSLNSVTLWSSLIYVIALFISTAIYGRFPSEEILSNLIPPLSIFLFISLLCMLHQLRADFAAMFCDSVVVI